MNGNCAYCAKWGDVFAMNPHAVELTEEEYQKLIDEIRANL